jgi:hypothetical protein
MQKLEAALAYKQKVEAVSQSAVDVKKEGLAAENKKRKELNKNIQDVSIPALYLLYTLAVSPLPSLFLLFLVL